MSTTYGPVYISTQTPNGTNGNKITDCNLPTTDVYLYGISNEVVTLVPFDKIQVQAYAQFYLEFDSTTVKIFNTVNGVNYYLNKDNGPNNLVNVSSGGGAYEFWNILIPGDNNSVIAQTNPNSVSTCFISLINTPQNYFLLNYSKNGRGEFDGNSDLTVDALSPGSNPLKTDNGAVACTYQFVLTSVYSVTPPSTLSILKNTTQGKTMYNVLASNSQRTPDNLKMVITHSDNKVNFETFRMKCHNEKSKIISSKPELLFSAEGQKDKQVEHNFDYTFKVEVITNHDIIEKSRYNQKISLYRINDDFIIMKCSNRYFLLTVSLFPSFTEIEYMINKFHKYIERCK